MPNKDLLLKFLMLLACQFNAIQVFNQHPYYKQITDADNLPTNELYRVVQDKFGFLWIGSDAGLYRYDGFRCKHYSSSKQNSRSISFVQVDSNQRVWCKNFYGQVFCVAADSLRLVYQKSTSDPSNPHFCVDDSSHVWVYEGMEMLKLNTEGKVLFNRKILSHVPGDEIITLHHFDGSIHIITKFHQAFKYDIKTQRLKPQVLKTGDGTQITDCMIVYHHHTLWFFIESQPDRAYNLYKLNGNEITFHTRLNDLMPSARIYGIYSDSENLWCFGSKGVIVIADSLNKVRGPDEVLFPGKKISCMIKDRERMLWFSSLQEGLFVMPQPEVHVLNNQNSKLGDNYITSLEGTNDGNLLLGDYQGRNYLFNPKTGKLDSVFSNHKHHFISVKKIIQNDQYTIVSKGKLMIYNHLLKREFYPYVSNFRDFELVNDTIWFVHSEMIGFAGLNELITESKFHKIRNVGARTIEYNPTEKLFYVGMADGTFTFDHSANFREILLHGEKVITNTISIDDGIVWLSTIANGLLGWKNGMIRYRFDTSNHLCQNEIKLTEVNGEYIWVVAGTVLYKINYLQNSVERYNKYNAIPANDINDIEILDPWIYLATNHGLYYFPVDLTPDNSVKPNLQITKFSVNGVKRDHTRKVFLPDDNKNISVELNTSSFKSMGDFAIEYRLADIDTNWVSLPGVNQGISIPRLSPGDHTLEIRLVNESGIKSDISFIQLDVEYPVWQRWWFLISAIMVLAGVILVLFRLRIAFIQRRTDLKSNMYKSQLVAIKSQMNPHFIFNTLNSLQDLILKQDVKKANYFLSKYADLMRSILQTSGLNEIELAEEITMLTNYLELEKLRFGDEFNYSIRCLDGLDVNSIHVPPMLIQPFVENAIKHGLLHKKGRKELSIRFIITDYLVCEIEDNGIGVTKSMEINQRRKREHQSFATSATAERMQLLSKYYQREYSFELIELRNEQEVRGTLVKVKIGLPLVK